MAQKTYTDFATTWDAAEAQEVNDFIHIIFGDPADEEEAFSDRTLTNTEFAGTNALTGTYVVTSTSLGTISSGTVTPNPQTQPMQHYTNGGAHTLAPSANAGSVLVDITNNGSAGAITTSGFTKVTGDTFTTTNGHKFRCSISIGNGGSLLVVQALQ
jgi:hypothetical protein